MKGRPTLHFIILLLFPVLLSAQTTAKDWYNKGMQLKEKQDYEAALTAFRNAISKKADYTEAYYQAGWCCNELEKCEDAVDLLRKYDPSTNELKKISSMSLVLPIINFKREMKQWRNTIKPLSYFQTMGLH